MAIRSVHRDLPESIRVSLGSAIALKLMQGKTDAPSTTAYLMTYRKGKCFANCRFCPQARRSRSRADMLSRISWPIFPTERVLEEIQSTAGGNAIKRVCIQALNYPGVFVHLEALVKMIKERTNMPISISCQPLVKENMKLMAEAGVDRIGIPLDAATRELFDRIKGGSAGGPYKWERQFELLHDAVGIFGRGKVSTHLIVGLGETEQEMIGMIQKCVDIGVLPALFAFTPIFGTELEGRSQPPIEKFRRIQVARSLILHKAATFENMHFNEQGQVIDFSADKRVVRKIVRSGEPFVTSGCPGCNRPYYNEKPSGPLYSFPRKLTEEELCGIREQLGLNGA